MPRIHGTGVRLDADPQRFDREVAPKPKKQAKTPALYTYEKNANKLKPVSADAAKKLETAFQASSAKVENLSGGRAGASVMGLVQNGELFIRTKGVFPGAKPKWESAGKLQEPPAPKPNDGTRPSPGWGPKPKSLEARVQKTVAERMGLLSNPEFQLKGNELKEFKKGLANGEFQEVAATPKGLAGVGFKGYVAGDMLIVERRAVRPGATSTFHLLGPLS
jgi:hypothetical protein